MKKVFFPGLQSIYNPDEIEERRLAYVAITRAEEEVALLNAESRMLFGSTTRNKASRFLSEIPEELVERSRSVHGKNRHRAQAPTSAYEARKLPPILPEILVLSICQKQNHPVKNWQWAIR